MDYKIDRIKTAALSLGQTLYFTMRMGVKGLPCALGTGFLIMLGHRADLAAKRYVETKNKPN